MAPRAALDDVTQKTAKQAECDKAYQEILLRIGATRTKNNLANIKRALDHMVSIGVSDFSRANVARALRSKELNIRSPGQSALYNPGREPFEELIAAYAKAYNRHSENTCSKTDADDLISLIPDEGIRAQVQIVLNENQALRIANTSLKNLVSRLQPRSPKELLALAGDSEAAVSPNGVVCTPAEAAAVRRFLSKATDMLACQWDATGALLTLHGGMEVAGPRFRRILEALSDQDPERRDTGGGGQSAHRQRVLGPPSDI